MDKRSLLITGADGALGRVVAKKLLADGWTLYAAAHNEKSKEELQGLFPAETSKTLFISMADLSQEKDVKNYVSSAKDISGLVHIAGGYKEGKSIADYSFEDFEFLMNLNAKPTFLLLKEVLPLLKNNSGGAIVTIGAKVAVKPAKGNAVYAASKSAVVAMTLSVAEEGRQFNIRANSILPDTLQTANNLSWATEEQFQKFTPLQDVADTVAFLVSEQGRGVNGVALRMYHKLNT